MARDEDDRRMRKVHASDRLMLLFGEYQRSLLEMLSDLRSPQSGDLSLKQEQGSE